MKITKQSVKKLRIWYQEMWGFGLVMDNMRLYIYRLIVSVKISEVWNEWCRSNWLVLCDRHRHLKCHMDMSSNSSFRTWLWMRLYICRYMKGPHSNERYICIGKFLPIGWLFIIEDKFRHICLLFIWNNIWLELD